MEGRAVSNVADIKGKMKGLIVFKKTNKIRKY